MTELIIQIFNWEKISITLTDPSRTSTQCRPWTCHVCLTVPGFWLREVRHAGSVTNMMLCHQGLLKTEVTWSHTEWFLTPWTSLTIIQLLWMILPSRITVPNVVISLFVFSDAWGRTQQSFLGVFPWVSETFKIYVDVLTGYKARQLWHVNVCIIQPPDLVETHNVTPFKPHQVLLMLQKHPLSDDSHSLLCMNECWMLLQLPDNTFTPLLMPHCLYQTGSFLLGV